MQESFDLALAALQMAGIPEDSTPELVVKQGTDAKSLRLILPEIASPPAKPASGAAMQEWKDKLAALQKAEALIPMTDVEDRRLNAKQQAEAKRKIAELEPELKTLPPEIAVVPKGLRSYEKEDAGFFLRLLPGPRRLSRN